MLIPDEYKKFAQKKKEEFYMVVKTSSIVGLILSNVLAVFKFEWTMTILF